MTPASDPCVARYRDLLIPGELARNYQTIRASHNGKAMVGKWSQYACTSSELFNFFQELSQP